MVRAALGAEPGGKWKRKGGIRAGFPKPQAEIIIFRRNHFISKRKRGTLSHVYRAEIFFFYVESYPSKSETAAFSVANSSSVALIFPVAYSLNSIPLTNS